jgi:hypothetical protein
MDFKAIIKYQLQLKTNEKTTFTIDWGIYACRVMPFGLCNAPITFQRIVMMVFENYLHLSMEMFLNDFCVFSTVAYHPKKLQLCFNQCDQMAFPQMLLSVNFSLRKKNY